jgi:hypothetical protein
MLSMVVPYAKKIETATDSFQGLVFGQLDTRFFSAKNATFRVYQGQPIDPLHGASAVSCMEN